MTTVLTLAWQRYLNELQRRPLRTKATTAGIIAAAADILAQRIENPKGSLHWRRTAALALLGLLWSGPSGHYWQAFLERLFPRKNDPLRPIKKVLFDQITYGPFCNILFMTFVAKVLENHTWTDTKNKIIQNYPAVQRRGWLVWPAASLIAQTYIPLDLRVLWANGVAFGWSTFLILLSRRGKGSSAATKKQA